MTSGRGRLLEAHDLWFSTGDREGANLREAEFGAGGGANVRLCTWDGSRFASWQHGNTATADGARRSKGQSGRGGRCGWGTKGRARSEGSAEDDGGHCVFRIKLKRLVWTVCVWCRDAKS